MAASSQQNAQIWNGLHSLGLNDTAAAGVMGNMAQESSMNPQEAGGGLMQWINGRWTALVNYARSKGLSPDSAAAQVGYFGQELTAGNEGITLQGLNAQPSPAAAALYVSENYERPKASAANNPNREAQAGAFYSQFTGGKASSAGLPTATPTSAGGSSQGTSEQSSNPFPSGNDIIDEIDKSMKIQNFDIIHPAASLTQDAGAISLRVVMVLIGLILIIFGLVAVVEKTVPQGLQAGPVKV